MKKTPVYDLHLAAGGKMIDFNGWFLPVEYEGIIKEHETVRSAAGLFDVTHMGEIIVKGRDAENYLQRMLTNNILPMKDLQVYYSLMCYPDGGVVDDLIIYKFNREHYLLVVNSSNTEKDFQWLQEHQEGQVEVSNISNQYAQFAIQGPEAQNILQKLTPTDLNQIKFFRFQPNLTLDNIPVLISRTGYTGEDGFEMYIAPSQASQVWQALLESGKEFGLVPVGLGARDTLRFEAALPLYGQELGKEITPLEAGLGSFVKLDKENFIGKGALVKQKESGIQRKLIGFEMIDRGIPRSHYVVQRNGQEIGYVTTGGFSPSLRKNIGLAMIESQYAEEGQHVDIIIRNKALRAKIIPTPFYNKRYRKV